VLTLTNDVQWYGSLRSRTGLIVDNLLLYVTGGFAYAKIDNIWTINDPNTAPTVESFSAKDNRWGGVLGVGAEWAFNANWSIRTEFLYYIFKEVETSGFSQNAPGPVNFDSQDSMWVTRFAINYRFGDYGKAPVAARY
jgi:outer membrane immunogenic protein